MTTSDLLTITAEVTRRVLDPSDRVRHIDLAKRWDWTPDQVARHLDELLDRPAFQARHRTQHAGRPALPRRNWPAPRCCNRRSTSMATGTCGARLVYEYAARGLEHWRCLDCGDAYWWPENR